MVIEPNDSIMIRLNTLDFDESLVFTGQGAAGRPQVSALRALKSQ